MKFLIMALAILLLSALAFAAPDESTSRTTLNESVSNPNAVLRSITPEVGLNITDTTSSRMSSKTGLLVGAAVDLFKAGNLTLETGLLYKQEGGTWNQSGNTLHMNYLVVPVAAKYFFSGERANGFYAKGGLTPAVNVAHYYTNPSGTVSRDIQGASTFDFGVLIGVGGKVALTTETALILEADYVKGLTNIINPANVRSGASISNTGVSFLSGVAFNM